MTTTARQNGHTAHTPAAPGFGQALRTHRLRAGMSIKGLSAAMGMDHSMISRLEVGKRNPSRETVLALAEALGLSVVERAGLMAEARLLPDEISPGQIMMMVMWQEAGQRPSAGDAPLAHSTAAQSVVTAKQESCHG